MNPSEVWLVWPKMFFAPDSELDVTSTMIDLQTIRDNLITLSLIVLIPLTQLISLVRVSCSEVLHTKQYWEGVSWPITIWVTCSYLTNNNYHTHTSPDTAHVHSSPTRSKLQAKIIIYSSHADMRHLVHFPRVIIVFSNSFEFVSLPASWLPHFIFSPLQLHTTLEIQNTKLSVRR